MALTARPSPDSVSSSAASSSAEPLSVPSGTHRPALWLVRHGQSTWNTAGLAQGHNDEAELTSQGLSQAAEAAERFRGRAVRAIYASDLRRAMQTAEFFSKVLDRPVFTDARLRERSLGVFEGTPSADIGPSVTGLDAGRVADPDTRPHSGESVRDLYARAAAFCDALAIEVTDSHNDGRRVYHRLTESDGDIVIVAHGGTVRVLEAYLHGISVDEMAWGPVENAKVVRVPDFGAQPLST